MLFQKHEAKTKNIASSSLPTPILISVDGHWLSVTPVISGTGSNQTPFVCEGGSGSAL
jgi:hypothetical protein